MKINAINFLKLIFILFDCFILFNNCGGKNVGESQSSNKQFQINVSGTVYEDMGNQQYSPVNNALICDTEGNQLAVTNSSGFFSFNSFPESEKNLLVRLSGYYQSSTIINASENREVNFYIQKLDEKINEFGTSGPSGVIGYFRKAYNLLRSNSPAQFVYESNDKKAQITIKNWSLSKNVHLVLTAFNKSFNIPHLQKLREIDQGIIAAAADISILTGEGSTLVNSDEAGFSGIVEPKFRFQFSPYENWETIKSILNGEAYAGSASALKVYYFYNDDWMLAGEGILKYENGVHYFTTKSNVSIPKIAPIAFVMERPLVKYIVSGKVIDDLTLKPVQEAEILCENAERTVFTDSSGFYSLSAVIPFHSATIDLTCRKKNYYIKTGIVKFNTVQDTIYKTLNFSLSLVDSAFIQGTVTNSLGAPVQGAEVTIMNYSAFSNISVSYVLKSLTIADVQNAIYQWSYKSQDMDGWSIIIGSSSNVIYETAIINQLKLDGNYYGAYKLKAKVNYGSYSEEEEIAVFDANIKPSPPASPSGYKSVSLWGGEDRGYFFAAIPFGAQVDDYIWKTDIYWTNQYGYDSSIVPIKNSQSQNIKMIELYDYIGSNIDAIKKNSPSGNSYLTSGLKLNLSFEVGYGNYENYDTSASLIFNIAESGLHLTNLRLLTGNLTTKHFKTFTNERGEYVFPDVPLIFSNKIKVFADKNGYIKSDEQPVGVLSSSQNITRNLVLKEVNSVPASPERFRLHLVGKSIITEWSESKFALSYRIYYGIDKNNLSSFYTVNDTSSRSFEFSGLSNNDWYFAVTALNQYGESPKTSIIKYSHYILTGGMLTGTISYSGNRGTVSSLKPLFVYLYSYSNKYLSGYPVMSAEISENGGQFLIPDIQSGEYSLIAGYNAESVSPDRITNSQISYIVYPDSKIADVKENISIPFSVNNGGNINFNFIIDDKYINDVTPPQIINISPEYYSNNVSVKPVISITFSEPMNPESFNHSGENKWLAGSAFNVNPPDIILWSADKTILTYQWSSYSDSPYNYNTFYSASSRTDNFAPKDLSGNILIKYNYIFKTESRADTSLAGYVRLNSTNPDALNMLFGSIYSAYDNIYIPPNDPAHWKILAVNGYMQFAFTGKNDFIFHALGATSFNESYCYVNIYINGLLYLSNAFIDKYWNNYSIAGSNFSEGNNIVKIELIGSTQFWIDEAYITEPSSNEIITPSPESNYLFADTFATGNYNKWVKHSSSTADFSVVNNELRQSNTASDIKYNSLIYPNGYNWKNYKLSLNARHISNYYQSTSINIYFRIQQNIFSNDNCPSGYCVRIQPGGYGGLYNYSQSGCELIQNFSPDLTYPNYNGYSIRIEALENSIKVFIDEKKVIDVVDNAFDTGTIGLASVHCIAGFDNVFVEPLTGGQTITAKAFAVTAGYYSETDNLIEKVKQEFGDAAEIADWNELKTVITDSAKLAEFLTECNLQHDSVALLTRNGARLYSGSRHYYLHYSNDGLPYPEFSAHDINQSLYLGSWYNIRMPILVKLNSNFQTGSDTTALSYFFDDFSGDLSKWNIFSNTYGSWQIINGKLRADWNISAGSNYHPHSYIILKDEYQPSGDYAVSVKFNRVTEPLQPTYISAVAQFELFESANKRIELTLGIGGYNLTENQTTITYSYSMWNGSQRTTPVSSTIPYNWNTGLEHTAKMIKTGNTYNFYIDDFFIFQYIDNYLNGSGKIGLHTYGPKLYDDFQILTDFSFDSYYAFYDLNDNQIPSGWTQTIVNSGPGVYDGGLRANTTDGSSTLKRYFNISADAVEITMSYDGNIAYSVWGLKHCVRAYTGDTYYYIEHMTAQWSYPSASLVQIYKQKNDADRNILYENTQSLIYSNYRYTVKFRDGMIKFKAVNLSDSTVLFDISINDNSFILKNITALAWGVSATTNNNAWADNLELKISTVISD